MTEQVHIRFTNPNKDNYSRNIMYSSIIGRRLTDKNRHKGDCAVILGSGPSLDTDEVKTALRELYSEPNTHFYACKAAIKWCADNVGVPEYGVSIDPGAHIACESKIPRVPGVIHIMATSSAPEVFDYLENERVELFHSVCGGEDELNLYKTLFEDSGIMQGGFNVINRALSISQYHGCVKYIFAGCDSGWREDQQIYIDGSKMMQKKVYMNDAGAVDGKVWHSTPDMIASGVALARFAQNYDKMGDRDRVVFLGDVLPRAVRDKPDDFLEEVASAA